MLREVLAVLVVLAACAGCAGAAERAAIKIDETRYLTADKLRPGMKGHGLTVFEGTKPERFDVEIIGVMHNAWGIDSDIVLVRCSGHNLEHTGIAAGMSGSPIYVGDKLIGALAYGFPYAKTAVAGVTPIAEMLPLAARAPAKERKPTAGGAVELDAPLVVFGEEFSTVKLVERPSGHRPKSGTMELAPIATPLRVSGFGPPPTARRWLRQFARELEPTGLVPVQGGRPGKAEAADAELVPGATIGARLLWGDLNWDAIGTVTEVVGDRVLGLGHPMLGEQDVRIPMTTGRIFTLMPSFRRTFKLGSGLDIVGVIDTDRQTGIAGTKGAKPDSVKLSVAITGLTGAEETQTYRFETLRHPVVTGRMIGMAVTSCMTRSGDPPEELTARFRVTATFEGRDRLVVENVASGRSGQSALNGVFRTVRGLVGALTDNEFERVFPESVQVEARFEHGRRFAHIESVSVDRTTVRRGGSLTVTVELRHVLGKRGRKTIDVPIAGDAPLGRAILHVCDSRTAFDSARKDSPGRFEPRTLDQLFRLLREPYRADRIYVRLSYPGAGVAIEGRELPDLPSSVLGTIASHRKSGLTYVRNTVVKRVPSPVVVDGSQVVQIQIEEEK
ncbi:MAG: SpoIVB peptidase S55 domain-containing protein [Planctomycetota bacterium]